MADDQVNWDEVREGTIDDTLKIVRDQRDNQLRSDYSGIETFNPTRLKKGKMTILGPVYFPVPFSKTPQMSLTSVSESTDATLTVDARSVHTPLIIIPQVYKWKNTSGGVDGFWISVYALTAPPTSLYKHHVHWRAVGEGSSYNHTNPSTSWTDQYHGNDTHYVHDETYPGEYEA